MEPLGASELVEEPGLAHARLAHDRGDLATPSLGLGEEPEKGLELVRRVPRIGSGGVPRDRIPSARAGRGDAREGHRPDPRDRARTGAPGAGPPPRSRVRSRARRARRSRRGRARPRASPRARSPSRPRTGRPGGGPRGPLPGLRGCADLPPGPAPRSSAVRWPRGRLAERRPPRARGRTRRRSPSGSDPGASRRSSAPCRSVRGARRPCRRREHRVRRGSRTGTPDGALPTGRRPTMGLARRSSRHRVRSAAETRRAWHAPAVEPVAPPVGGARTCRGDSGACSARC